MKVYENPSHQEHDTEGTTITEEEKEADRVVGPYN